MVVQGGLESKLKVFVSYSRADASFADEIVTALEARGFTAIIDKRDLPYGQKWQKELEGFIQNSDAVLFIVSPNSITSHWCRWEVAQVTVQSKRLIPVVIEDVPVESLPPEIGEIHLFPFTTTHDYSTRADALAEVLSTDRAWLREHTRFGDLASVWQANGQSVDLLLRGNALLQAELWSARRPQTAPAPSQQHFAFIAAGQTLAKRNSRRWAAGLAAITFGAISLAGLAWVQKNNAEDQKRIAQINEAEANKQRTIAVRQQAEAETARRKAEEETKRADSQLREAQLSQSRFLTGKAQDALNNHDYNTSALLALEGLPDQMSGNQRPALLSLSLILDASLRNQTELAVLKDLGTGTPKAFSFPHSRFAAFSPDGRMVATASSKNSAIVWDAQTGKQLAILSRHAAQVESVAFSFDSKFIVTASADKTAVVWNAQTGQVCANLIGHQDKIQTAKFSPDGRRIVTSSFDKTAILWDIASGKQLAALSGHDGWLFSADFSPDGKTIVTTSLDGSARIWDAVTGLNKIVLKRPDGRISAAIYSPDSEFLATIATIGSNVLIYSVESGQQVGRLESDEAIIYSATYSPNGKSLVVISNNNSARNFDAVSGKVISTLNGHQDRITDAQFSADGIHIVTASRDKTARIWEADSGKEISVLRGHTDEVRGVLFSSKAARVLTLSNDETARIWDTDVGKIGIGIKPQTRWSRVTKFSVDGQRLVGFEGTIATVYNLVGGKSLVELEGLSKSITAAAISADGKFVVAGSEDGTIIVWDVDSRKPIAKYNGHETEVNTVAFSPNSDTVVSADGRSMRVWQIKTGVTVTILEGHDDFVQSASFSLDGKFVISASNDGTARLWEALTGTPLAVLKIASSALTDASLEADGKRLVVAARDKTARVWNLESGKEVAILLGHEGDVRSVEFSLDGKYIVTASEDNTIRIWESWSGQEIYRISETTQRVNFAPDGNSLFIAFQDHAMVRPLLPTGQGLIELAKKRLSRCLTIQQRSAYSLDDGSPYWCYEMAKWPYKPIRFGLKLGLAQSKKLAENSFDESGVYVSKLIRNSEAERSGIMLGDKVFLINGKPVADEAAAFEILENIPNGADAILGIERNGKHAEIRIPSN